MKKEFTKVVNGMVNGFTIPKSPFDGKMALNTRINGAFFTGKKVADIGCGLKKFPSERDGLVFDMTYIDSRKEVEPDICCNILDGIPVPDATFDAVYTCHFMEHFIEDGWNHYEGWDSMDKVTSEIHRILKPNGDFIVIVPSPHSGMAISPDHKSVYSISMWRGVLSRKFKVMAMKGVGTWIDVPELYQFFASLSMQHPFFGEEYAIWCKK